MKRARDERGMTLVELMFAVAILLMVLGATAQSLISYYVALDLQNQRVVAIRHCTGVLSSIRAFRDANTGPFPDAITEQWPDGTEVAGVAALHQEAVTVAYTDSNANPLEVVVTSAWLDLRGRPVSASISTRLTNQ